MTHARPRFETPNMSGGSECAHCTDDGQVILDDESEGARSMPCPMCERGGQWNMVRREDRPWSVGNRHGKGIAPWDRCDLRSVTWERGLTGAHTHRCRMEQCPRPSTSTYCDYHDDPANRVGRGVPEWRPSRSIGSMGDVVTPQEQAMMNAAKGLNHWAPTRE